MSLSILLINGKLGTTKDLASQIVHLGPIYIRKT
jgi:hypothetical protein